MRGTSSTPTATATATASATASSPTPRASMFAAKTGFVIPKNKLSGALVPIFRPSSATDADNPHRKTKWAPHLSQDPAVRKARALAYQTRVDQITQLLKSGSLDGGDNQHTVTTIQHADDKSCSIHDDSKTLVLLEIERREAIGEILRLNPSYKAPNDYKPLLKEATIPVPIKEHPGYNFVALLFGPGGDTKKRLEKETGTKIRVYGIKDQITGEKVEISSPDGHEFQGAYKDLHEFQGAYKDLHEFQVAYKDLHVCVTAETFDKVDAAVVLVELLIQSISGNLGAGSTSNSVSGDDGNIQTQAQNSAPPYTIGNAAINAGLPQSSQPSAQGHIQHPSPWLHAGVSSPNLPGQTLQSAPLNMPSLFGPRPALPDLYNSIAPGNAQPSSQVLSQAPVPLMYPQGHAGIPSNFLMATQNSCSAQPYSSLPFPSASQALQLGSVPVTRPAMPSLPPAPGPSSHGKLAPQAIPAQVSHPFTGPAALPSFANVPGSFQTAQSGLQLSTAPINHPAPTIFPVGSYHPAPVVSFNSTSISLSMPAMQSSMSSNEIPPVNPGRMPTPIFSPVPSASPQPPPQVHFLGPGPVGTAGFAPKLQHANCDDFTFRPLLPQNPAPSMVPGPFPQRGLQGASTRPIVQPQAGQDSPFHFVGRNSTFQAANQVFPGPLSGNQLGRPSSHVPSSAYASNSFGMSAPPRPPVPLLLNPGTAPGPQPGFRASQFPNMSGPFPPMLQQRYPEAPSWPRNYMHTNSQPPFARPGFTHFGERQSYDPFSPSSMPVGPQQQGMLRKQESDPEYEDLMSSVGVK